MRSNEPKRDHQLRKVRENHHENVSTCCQERFLERFTREIMYVDWCEVKRDSTASLRPSTGPQKRSRGKLG